MKVMRLRLHSKIISNSLVGRRAIVALRRHFIISIVLSLWWFPGLVDAQQREKVRVAPGFDLGKFERDTDRRSARVVWKIRHRSGTNLFWRRHEFDCRADIEFGAASGGGFHRDDWRAIGGIDITMFAVQSNKLDYSVMVAPDVKIRRTSRARS